MENTENFDFIDSVKCSMPPEEDVYSLADFFKTMGDSTRLKIILALLGRELRVTDIARVVDMSTSAVSHQLKTLRLSKLIRARKDGRTVLYSLDDDHIRDILAKSLEHVQE